MPLLFENSKYLIALIITSNMMMNRDGWWDKYCLFMDLIEMI